jgi:hypothetical protein
VVEGSYAEWSRDIILGIADAVPNDKWLDNSAPHLRVNLNTFPHAELTGIMWSSRGPISGRRFYAITPRHIFGCGHYGGDIQIGTVCKWLTADNQEVSRTVIGRYNLLQQGPSTLYDTAIYLLNEALPETIVPLQIMGDWCRTFTSTSVEITSYKILYGFGMMIWGNDGDWSPLCPFIIRTPLNNRHFGAGFPFTSADGPFFSGLGSFWDRYGRPDLSNVNGNKFYHDRRGGDSGCPMVMPCGNGWMLAGTADGEVVFSENFMNSIIATVDASAGVSTNLTVTVATDPTL